MYKAYTQICTKLSPKAITNNEFTMHYNKKPTRGYDKRKLSFDKNKKLEDSNLNVTNSNLSVVQCSMNFHMYQRKMISNY